MNVSSAHSPCVCWVSLAAHVAVAIQREGQIVRGIPRRHRLRLAAQGLRQPADYERGKLRLSAEMALRLAAALDVPIQELLALSQPLAVERAPRPSRRLLRRLEQIQRLPRRKQAALLTTIDTFLRAG